MSLKKRNIYDRLDSEPENLTGPNNPSQKVDEYTNFVLRSITLEDLDEAMYRSFNERFIVSDKSLNLISLDQEVASMRFENPEKFNDLTQYLKLPYYTFWRVDDEQMFRTSPFYKKVIYARPVQKEQGVVYEEYITKAPKFLKVYYTFKFITTMREYANQYEQQMLELFENKRIIVGLDRERFHLQPTDVNKICKLEVTKRANTGKSLYTLTSDLVLWAYIRDSKDMQKRERPNTFTLKVSEKTGDGDENITLNETITRFDT